MTKIKRLENEGSTDLFMGIICGLKGILLSTALYLVFMPLLVIASNVAFGEGGSNNFLLARCINAIAYGWYTALETGLGYVPAGKTSKWLRLLALCIAFSFVAAFLIEVATHFLFLEGYFKPDYSLFLILTLAALGGIVGSLPYIKWSSRTLQKINLRIMHRKIARKASEQKNEEPTDFLTGIVSAGFAAVKAIFYYVVGAIVAMVIVGMFIGKDSAFLLLFRLGGAFIIGMVVGDSAGYGYGLASKTSKRLPPLVLALSFGLLAVLFIDTIFGLLCYPNYSYGISYAIILIVISTAIGTIMGVSDWFKSSDQKSQEIYLHPAFLELIKATEYKPFTKDDYKKGLWDYALRCPKCGTIFEYIREFFEEDGIPDQGVSGEIVSIEKPYVKTLMPAFSKDECFCPRCHIKVKMEPMKRIRKSGTRFGYPAKEFVSQWFHEDPTKSIKDQKQQYN